MLARIRQADLAREVGISPAYLNLIEHNRRRPAEGIVAAIARVLGVEAKALAEGAEDELFEALREAAGTTGGGLPEGGGPELERIDEFVTRFPGWAGLLAGRQARVKALERSVEELSDRMAHDPHLSAAVHEVLSSVTSVRSTAAILAETEDIDPAWRVRFHANLDADSQRLTEAATALVAFLDAVEVGETGVTSPQEEVEAWLASGLASGPGPGGRGSGTEGQAAGGTAEPELASGAARSLARDLGEQMQADATALPDGMLREALDRDGVSPAAIAARAGVPLAVVLRRLGLGDGRVHPELAPLGFVACDAAGAFALRRKPEGFAMPRHGAACPLWPIYEALRQPSVPLRRVVETAERLPRRFVAYALGETRSPAGFDGPLVATAMMLLVPAEPGQGQSDPAVPVGAACRTCPRAGCVARREPSILGDAI
ncbi:MAG: hypothetical protein RLZZ528_2798 [Pseudomonadota bacterium]